MIPYVASLLSIRFFFIACFYFLKSFILFIHLLYYICACIQTKPQDVLRPTHAQATIEHLLTLLDSSHLANKPLMLHGFSVGGYMYGEMLVKLRDHSDKWGKVCVLS